MDFDRPLPALDRTKAGSPPTGDDPCRFEKSSTPSAKPVPGPLPGGRAAKHTARLTSRFLPSDFLLLISGPPRASNCCIPGRARRGRKTFFGSPASGFPQKRAAGPFVDGFAAFNARPRLLDARACAPCLIGTHRGPAVAAFTAEKGKYHDRP